MHLGNGAITPECAAVAFTVAGGGLSLAARSLRRTEIDRDRLLTAGALTGAIFAAQMVNISVLPFSSAHLVGGALAAWVLGPALGAFAMAVVLTSQALLLGDGGLMTLGANIINMALLPSATVALIRGRPTRAVAGAAAATAVVGAAVLIIGEVGLFRSAAQLHGLGAFAGQMIGIHLWIALPEGLLTVAILCALGGVVVPGQLRLDQTRLAGCWGAAALLILCLLPFASPMPDGYEAAAERSGMTALLAEEEPEIESVGQTNARVARIQDLIVMAVHQTLASDQLLGLVSTTLTGLAAYGVTYLVARRPAKFC
jgi:cobalt/nickel transport system permease protein